MRRDSGLVSGACSLVACAAVLAFGLVILAAALFGCSAPPGPCSEEGLPPGDPPPGPVPDPGNPQPPPSGAECADGSCGYARKPDGEVCSCSLADVERSMRCGDLEAAEQGPIGNPPCDPGSEDCSWPQQPEPDANGLCGYYALCCYRFTFLHEFNPSKGRYDKSVYELHNIPICPRIHLPGAPETRHSAYTYWGPRAMAAYLDLEADMISADGFVDAINCYDNGYNESDFMCSPWPHNHPLVRP